MPQLDFEQVLEGKEVVIYVNVAQFQKKQATEKMYCRHCKKIVKAFGPSACWGKKRADKQTLFAPLWLTMRSFCSKCGWMYKPKNIPAIIKKAVIEKDGDECVYCGISALHAYEMQFDHVVPQIMGGNATEENIVRACGFCNAAKGTREAKAKPQFGRFAAGGGGDFRAGLLLRGDGGEAI